MWQCAGSYVLKPKTIVNICCDSFVTMKTLSKTGFRTFPNLGHSETCFFRQVGHKRRWRELKKWFSPIKSGGRTGSISPQWFFIWRRLGIWWFPWNRQGERLGINLLEVDSQKLAQLQNNLAWGMQSYQWNKVIKITRRKCHVVVIFLFEMFWGSCDVSCMAVSWFSLLSGVRGST